MIVRRIALVAMLATLATLAMLAPAATAFVNPGFSTSINWSGYQVEARGVSFDRVSGSWTEVRGVCLDGVPIETTWVGLGDPVLGGTGVTRLQQIGTWDACGNRTSHHSFWEDVPGPSHLIRNPVRAGDEMHASVTIVGHVVTMKLTDSTRHWSFIKRLQVASIDERAAEWIAEEIFGSGTGRSSAFAPITFTRAQARDTTGLTGSITSAPWAANKIDLVAGNPLRLLALPSALSASGAGFRVTSTDTSPPSQPPPPV
jgi:hypothetical protein